MVTLGCLGSISLAPIIIQSARIPPPTKLVLSAPAEHKQSERLYHPTARPNRHISTATPPPPPSPSLSLSQFSIKALHPAHPSLLLCSVPWDYLSPWLVSHPNQKRPLFLPRQIWCEKLCSPRRHSLQRSP